MKTLLSFIEWQDYINEYENGQELVESLKDLGLDGIEIVRCGYISDIPKDFIYGIHLPFFTSWVDYYNKDYKRVKEEFSSLSLAEKFYGYKPEDFHKYFLEDLEYGEKYCDYTVFHVANANSLEYLSRKHHLTDEEVIDASADLINKMLAGKKDGNLFLLENLYFPGLQFNDVNKTKRLLEKIKYKNIGFMLDTGHLMNTNLDLKTEDEGWDYIEKVVEDHKDLIDYFKGVHLQVSVSGQIVKDIEKNPPKMEEDFYKRFEQIYEAVKNIDTHSIARSHQAKRVIEKINPDYLVLEFKSENRLEREEKIKDQLKILQKIK